MSRLGTLSEIEKLATTLELDPDELAFLQAVAPEELRSFRISIYDRLFKQDAVLFERLAALSTRLPPRASARLAERSLGPLIAARVAAEMPARTAMAIAQVVSVGFFADVAAYLDPRRTHEMITALTPERVAAIGRILVARGEHMTISRFIEYVTDEQAKATIAAIEDEADILRITFYLGAKNRIDHLFASLPHERIERMVVRVQEEGEALLPAFLSVLIHVSYALKRDLAEIIAAQDAAVMTGYIEATHRGELWPDVLPVVMTMSPEARRRVVNLPVLARRDVQEAIVRSADEHLQLSSLLELADTMGERNRDAFAEILALRGRPTLRRAVEAALLAERWDTLLDLAARMPRAARTELAASIVELLAPHDAELLERVTAIAHRHGVGEVAYLTSESRTGDSVSSAYS